MPNALAALRASRQAEGRRRMTHEAWAPPEDLQRLRTAGNWLTGPVATDDYGNEIPNDSSSLASLINSLVPHPGQSEEQIAENTLGLMLPAGGVGPVKHLVRGTVPEQALRATVWHGSPHKFAPTEGNALGDFDASKIGTGEGAQAYGHGLYFAEEPGVAKTYAAETAFKHGQHDIAEMLYSQKLGDIPAAKKSLQVEIDQYDKRGWPSPEYKRQYDEAVAKLDGWQKNGPPKAGNLYKVDIPDDQVAKMLDWDKPLSEQAEAVRNALEKVGVDPYPMASVGPTVNRKTGETAYRALARPPSGAVTLKNSSAANREAFDAATRKASETLRAAGIPGIRYLDQGSRGVSAGEVLGAFKQGDKWVSKVRVKNRGGAGFATPTDQVTTSMRFDTEAQALQWAKTKAQGGTSNYVVFDPAITRILGRE